MQKVSSERQKPSARNLSCFAQGGVPVGRDCHLGQDICGIESAEQPLTSTGNFSRLAHEWTSDDTPNRHGNMSVSFIKEENEADESVNALRQETRIRAAMDSGSCRNVTHPNTIPPGVKITLNTTGKHFSGAGGEVIEKYGECVTSMESSHGQVDCRWNVADVRDHCAPSARSLDRTRVTATTMSSSTSAALWSSQASLKKS